MGTSTEIVTVQVEVIGAHDRHIVVSINGSKMSYIAFYTGPVTRSYKNNFIGLNTPNVMWLPREAREFCVYSLTYIRVKLDENMRFSPQEQKTLEVIKAAQQELFVPLESNFGLLVEHNVHQNVFWIQVASSIDISPPRNLNPPVRKVRFEGKQPNIALLYNCLYRWRDNRPPIAYPIGGNSQSVAFGHASTVNANHQVAFNNWQNFNSRELLSKEVLVSGVKVTSVSSEKLLNNLGYLETNLPSEEWAEIEATLKKIGATWTPIR